MGGGGSVFFDLFGTVWGSVRVGELASAQHLAVADGLLADHLVAVTVRSGDADGDGALLDRSTLPLVSDVFCLLGLVSHAGSPTP